MVATQLDADRNVSRAQLVRGVEITGPTRIPIDVDQYGVYLDQVPINTDRPLQTAYVNGVTEGGTWFSCGGRGARRLPDSVRRAGDSHTLHTIALISEVFTSPTWTSRAAVPIEDDHVDLIVPTIDATVTFDAGPPAGATWTTHDGWEGIGLYLAQDNFYEVPSSNVYITDRALALGEAPALPATLPAGWQPAWTVDTTGYYRWSSWVSRSRPDGGTEWVTTYGGDRDPNQ